MDENFKTGIYIRVSTEEQAKDGFSISAQKEKLTKYAELCDWCIYDYYIDNGVSAKNIINRPEINRMLNDLKAGNINNILVYKLDRLTRNLKDLIYLIELFEFYKCAFNSQTEKIDTSNAVGRMFVKIIGIFAEFERENLAERISFGYEQKTREGNYTNTNGVNGYDYIVGKQQLVVNESEKIIVNKIYDLYIEGLSYNSIAKKFNMENVPTKRGGKWASSTIKSILINPLYIGKVRYSVNNRKKSFSVSAKNIEPIIDYKKWNLVQELIKKRKAVKINRYTNKESYFFHTVRCNRCGCFLLAKQQIKNKKLYISYKCNNCNIASFSHRNMENSFFKYISNIQDIKIDKTLIKNCITNSVLNNYDFEDIKKTVENIKYNWLYLTSIEKKHFLERFVDYILVDKINNNVIINTIKFKKNNCGNNE